MAAPITVEDITGDEGYLGTSSWGSTPGASAQVQLAIDAEYANQVRKCKVAGVSAEAYPPDLLEALKRRVARNLAMRSAPLAVLPSVDGETNPAFIPRLDAEIRRYEAPWLRLVIG